MVSGEELFYQYIVHTMKRFGNLGNNLSLSLKGRMSIYECYKINQRKHWKPFFEHKMISPARSEKSLRLAELLSF